MAPSSILNQRGTKEYLSNDSACFFIIDNMRPVGKEKIYGSVPRYVRKEVAQVYIDKAACMHVPTTSTTTYSFLVTVSQKSQSLSHILLFSSFSSIRGYL